LSSPANITTFAIWSGPSTDRIGMSQCGETPRVRSTGNQRKQANTPWGSRTQKQLKALLPQRSVWSNWERLGCKGARHIIWTKIKQHINITTTNIWIQEMNKRIYENNKWKPLGNLAKSTGVVCRIF
jgi:hypothetical protein